MTRRVDGTPPRITAAWRGGSSDGRPGWRLQFAYDVKTISALKRAIPARSREWNDEGSWWWIAEDVEDQAIAVLPALAAFTKQGSLL